MEEGGDMGILERIKLFLAFVRKDARAKQSE